MKNRLLLSISLFSCFALQSYAPGGQLERAARIQELNDLADGIIGHMEQIREIEQKARLRRRDRIKIQDLTNEKTYLLRVFLMRLNEVRYTYFDNDLRALMAELGNQSSAFGLIGYIGLHEPQLMQQEKLQDYELPQGPPPFTSDEYLTHYREKLRP